MVPLILGNPNVFPDSPDKPSKESSAKLRFHGIFPTVDSSPQSDL